MRILLTNDDGIHAPGITALHRALSSPTPPAKPLAADILTVAPLTVQSAAGHGITFRQPLITKDVDVNEHMRGIAVDGRPADCVKLGLSCLWPERFAKDADSRKPNRPDLVVSGMNMGANVGINVLYSGTVAAALEAAFLGVPAIAVSLHHGTSHPRYDVAAAHACMVIERLLAASLMQPHSCISINLPITEREGPLPPVAVCPMNTHGLVDAYERNVNPLGETYYWSAGTPMEFHGTAPDSDVQTLQDGTITVTPLKYDLSDHATMSAWRSALGG